MSRNAGESVSKSIRTFPIRGESSRSDIIQEISQILRDIDSVPEKEAASVARVALPSFGSSSWVGLRGINEESPDLNFLEIIHTIKGLVRGRRACVLFTIPAWFLDSGNDLVRC
jgi:hypothetical protein